MSDRAGHLLLLRVILRVHDLVAPRARNRPPRLNLFTHLDLLQAKVVPLPFKAHQNGEVGHGGLHISGFKLKWLICYPASDMAGSCATCVAFFASQGYRISRDSSERRVSVSLLGQGESSD